MGNVCRGDMKSEQIGTDFLKDFGKYGQFFLLFESLDTAWKQSGRKAFSVTQACTNSSDKMIPFQV